MRYSVYLIAIVGLFNSCNQVNPTPDDTSVNSEKPELSNIDSFFPEEKAKILIVGTFHFNYPGLDEHKTNTDDKIDVLKEPKESEVTDLVEYIKKFKPTKIAIEALPGYQWNDKYKKYLNGEFREKRDERYQLAMRIGQEINLDTIHSIDSKSLSMCRLPHN